jgi:hypothetical protein
MLIYPQLSNGALAQFPIAKQRRQRTIVNTLADSTTVKVSDPYAEVVEWEIKYNSLSDTEILALQQFFAATEGSLNIFTFLDPTANLFSWSDHLDNVVWTKDPFLILTQGVTDPVAGTAGWHIANSGSGPQSIGQTLAAPGGYIYCFSSYLQSTQPTTVSLVCGAARRSWQLEQSWKRVSITTSGDPNSASVMFSLEIPAGAAADIFGIQVESQASPSVYKPTEIGGVYENASFRDDIFWFTTTDVNHHSAIVNIVHVNRL